MALGKGKPQDIRGEDCLAFDDCKRAIVRQQHGIQGRIQEIDNTGAFWQKAPSAT